MPRYNYSTRQWEKTPEEIEEEQRKAFEAQQEQSSVQRQVQTTRKKSFLENFLSAGLGNKIDVDFKNITSGYFKTPEALKDGYNPLKFELTKTIGSTGIKAMNEFTKGILNIGEGIGDTITYGEYHLLKKTGFLKNYIDPEDLKKEAQKDIFNNLFKESDKMASKNSITDYKTDSIINSLGYMYGLQASAGLGKTTASQTAISTAVTFESAYGHGLTEAYNAGASDKDANLYALISASAEAGSELMFGGIGKGTKAVGLSKSAIPLDDIVAEKLSKNCKSMIMQNLTRAIVKSAGEGVEEIVSGFFSGLGKKMTYMKDEDFNKILKDENLLDQFISGMVSAGLSSAPSAYKATKNNQNFVTGRTASEDEIYNKMIENKTNEKLSEKNNRLKQKAINEEVKKVIAKKQEKFKNMKIDERKIRAEVAKNINFDESTTELTKKELSDITESVDEAFEKGKLNFNYIYETYTPEETARLERLDKELSNKNLSKELEQKYQQEFNELLEQREEKINKEAEKNMFLQHTLYNEKLRRTNFELTKEEKKLVEKNKELKNFYEDAVKYGNNSEEAHKFFYALAKMSTQTEYQYRLTNSEELEQLGYNVNKKYKVSNGDTLESIANKYKISTEDIKKANNLTSNNIKVGQELIIPNKSAIINGLHDGDNKTIYINMDSENALNIIVGHETGHIFENTQEYTELKEMLFKIAEEDGTLADRRAELEELYKDVKNAKIDVELTNDLLGEKLFTDEKFIERLAEKPNLFTKIKDKIDDLVIKFKGTEEEKELRKIQNKFLEVYRRNDLQKYVAEADAKAKKETKKSTEKNVDFSIQFMKNNDKTPFVWLDSDISKLSKKQQEKYVIKYINRLAGQTIGTTDGDSIYIIDNFINYKNKSKNKTSSGEFYYGPTQYSNLKGMDAEILKNRILSELDNSIITSKFHKNKNDVGKRHSDYKIEKFDTRKSLVYDGNNVYEIKLDVAVMNDGTKVAYDLKQITKKNSYLPFIPQKKNSAYKMAIFQPSTLGLTSSYASNIPQTQEKIKSDKADYSLSKKDNKGRTLTKEEQQKLRNSKARDEDGRLMELYHGTRHNFDEFTKGSGEHGAGFYFTEDSNYANEFADDENGRVIKAYLNLENPLSKNIDINDEATKKFINEIENKWGLSESEIIECFNSEEWSSDLGAKVAEKMGYGKQDVENTLGFEIDSPEDFGITDYNAYLGAYAWNNGLNDLVRESGFDGIISRTYNSTSEDYEYIAFNNNQIVQIKDNNNLAPIKTNNLNEYIADVSAREAKQNALDKESVRQSIIDYLEENNITNPTKEDMMNAFDDYDVMDNSDTLNDANKAEKLYSDVADEILKENNSKYSLSKNNNTELNNYLEKNNFKLDDNGSLEYKELSNKQINSLVSIYRKNGYSDVSADYLRESLKESGRLKIPREVADRFIEKELGYRPEIDTTKVFEDAEGNKLTKNQVEFYKDSDVRDIRGRLIPVYHRTNAEFTIFDKKAGKQHGNKYGRGFYFSITPENYGNNEMKVYLNAKDGEYKYIPDMGYYIVQEPNMIKNVDNLNPTSNEDIRYSISKKGKLVDNKGNDVRLDVSDTGNTGTLMAIHNLTSDKLNGILDLGGFPSASIAVTNNYMSNANFGNISVLFDKSTIDPEVNSANKVYSRDAYTTRVPKIANEINEAGLKEVSKNIGVETWDLKSRYNEKSIEEVVDEIKSTDEMLDKYLETKNIKVPPVYRDFKGLLSLNQKYYEDFINKHPDLINMDYTDRMSYSTYEKYYQDVHDLFVNEAVEKGNGKITKQQAESLYKDYPHYNHWDYFLRDLKKVQELNGNQEFDEYATNKVKKILVDLNSKEYLDFVKDTISPMFGDKFVRNNKDFYTKSGNPRTFRQRYEPYTLENIVRIMNENAGTGQEGGFFTGIGELAGDASKRFTSIDDIKANEKLLQTQDREEYQNILSKYSDEMRDITYDILDQYGNMDTESYILRDKAVAESMKAIARKIADGKNITTKGIIQQFKRNYIDITDNQAKRVNSLIKNLSDIPTDYFEAKPQRAIGLDEIQAVVLPNTTDSELKNRLKELGINYVEYSPNIDGDRNRVINQFDNLKFSLSRKNNLAPIRGDYQVYSKDIRNNNLAPLREDITKKPASKNVNYSLNYAPTTYDDLENINKQYSEQPIVDENGNVEVPEVINPMDDRNMDEVGKKNIKSYQYENPEVKPYYQEMARYMLNDLDNSVRGEKYATEDLDYMGTSRQTTDDIAYLLDEYDYNYDDIKKGLNAIIQDNGAENIAVAKRLEILINERLLNGYTDSYGYDIPANEEYKDLVRNQNLAPTRDEVDFSAFDAMLPIENELERLSGRNEEKYRKAREKYQEQIENAKKVRKQKGKAREAWDTAMRLLVNENHEIDRLAKDSKNTTLKHKADMLNNYVAEAENDINNYQTDYNGEEIGKSVKQLFEPAKEQGLYESFNDYLINWSNIDRHKQGKGSLRWESTSQNLINEYEDKYPQFKEWAKDVWKYGKNALNTMEQSGLIDEKLKKKLLKMYPHYVPYMDNADLNKFIGSSDEIVPKSTIKTARGGMSTTKILPMEDALTRYAYSYRKSMRQNDLYKEIVNTLRANEISDIGAGDTRKEVTDLKESLYRDENGNYLKAYIDGDTKVVSISDDLFTSLQNTLKYQIKDLEDKLSFITKPVQTATKIKGNLVTSWNPTFIATNLMKDFQDAIFNSTDTAKFLKNYPSAFKELVQNKSKEVRQFRALYGSGTGQYIGSDIADKTTPKKGKGLLSKIKSANEIIELAPRFAEFKASLQNGASIAEAMYNAREVTTNFTRGGTITKAMNRNGFNFINASTQGFDKFIRNMSGQNGAKAFTGTLLKAIAYGVAPAVLNELIFGSGDDKDEDYDALPDYIKDNYYLFKMDNGEFVRIPKGRALSVFGSGARRMIEYMNGEKDAFKGYGTNTWNQIGFNNPEESFLFTPFIQTKNNKAWYGGDIVPKRLQDKPAGEQYDEKTDLFSKWLGKTFNKSPKKINYLIDQYSGGAGDIILPFITPEATNEYDNPGLRAIAPLRDKFVVNSTDDNKYVSDFYTMNDELKVKANSDYATDEDILRYKYSNSVSSELASLYKEKRLIQSDTSLSNSEKYKKASAIKKQINEIAKEGVKTFNDVNAVGNYAQVNDREFYKNTKGEWTKARDEDTEEINKFGLTATEKNNYYNTKNTISGISNKYKELSAKASKEEKEELSTLKKAEIINSIKSTDITNDAKAYLYNKYYGSDTKMNVITTLGIDMNKYLDFELQNFTADKDANGKSIKNSKKTKMINYINNMSGSYGEKIVIYKLHNMSDNTYNNEIVNYVKSQNISDTEKRAILEALNMEVDKSGNVRWK